MDNRKIDLKLEGGKRCRGFITERNNKGPLISIITAVYNGNQTIEETINSVINQNYPNTEYIIIDGGSIDGTIETIKKYDKLIDYWVSEPDRGIYDALNKGIDLARGEWLYFIGADDRLINADVLTHFFSSPSTSRMLYGNVIWGNTGKLYDGKFSKIKLFYKNICHQAIFYHKDLFRRLGKFELKYPFLADWVFNMRAFAAKDVKPAFINEVVAVYSADGMSIRNIDHVFVKDHARLVRQIFGIWHFFLLNLNAFMIKRFKIKLIN